MVSVHAMIIGDLYLDCIVKGPQIASLYSNVDFCSIQKTVIADKDFQGHCKNKIAVGFFMKWWSSVWWSL